MEKFSMKKSLLAKRIEGRNFDQSRIRLNDHSNKYKHDPKRKKRDEI